jgi:hypothetical protein
VQCFDWKRVSDAFDEDGGELTLLVGVVRVESVTVSPTNFGLQRRAVTYKCHAQREYDDSVGRDCETRPFS